MDKIKKQAQSIAESNELDDMSKARAIARAYKTMKEEKKSKTLVISKSVRSNSELLHGLLPCWRTSLCNHSM